MKCSGFGYKSTSCPQQYLVCMNNYWIKDCKNTVLKCANFITYNKKDESTLYAVNDKECPVYENVLTVQSRIQYE